MPELEVATSVPMLDVDGLLSALEAGERPVVIDLRSPAEHAVDRLPGAVNVPLFDDVQRAVIGTLYQHSSPAAAFEEGRRAARAGIDELVRAVAEAAAWRVPEIDLGARVMDMTQGGIEHLEGRLGPAPRRAPPSGAVVLHCWRGGLRSRAVVALLRGLGLERAVGLSGGYKAWRARVRADLEAWSAPPTFVLRGYTGVGKTLVLRALEAQRPGATLDLEALAGHRSSILGGVGLAPCSQKAFETRLFLRLRAGFAQGWAVLEGESRKVGDAIQPARVWDALEGGVNLRLAAPPERRAEVLVADYLAREEHRAELRAALPFLEERLGRTKYKGVLTALLDARRDRELALLLLERYYDPLYAHSEAGRTCAATFEASDPVRCASAVARWIDARRPAFP
jgi:tRNA 2-selenouridine synthase